MIKSLLRLVLTLGFIAAAPALANRSANHNNCIREGDYGWITFKQVIDAASPGDGAEK